MGGKEFGEPSCCDSALFSVFAFTGWLFTFSFFSAKGVLEQTILIDVEEETEKDLDLMAGVLRVCMIK